MDYPEHGHDIYVFGYLVCMVYKLVGGGAARVGNIPAHEVVVSLIRLAPGVNARKRAAQRVLIEYGKHKAAPVVVIEGFASARLGVVPFYVAELGVLVVGFHEYYGKHLLFPESD